MSLFKQDCKLLINGKFEDITLNVIDNNTLFNIKWHAISNDYKYNKIYDFYKISEVVMNEVAYNAIVSFDITNYYNSFSVFNKKRKENNEIEAIIILKVHWIDNKNKIIYNNVRGNFTYENITPIPFVKTLHSQSNFLMQNYVINTVLINNHNNDLTNRKKVGNLYLRKSTKSNKSGQSLVYPSSDIKEIMEDDIAIIEQFRSLKDYARRHNMIIGNILIHYGISGSYNPNKKVYHLEKPDFKNFLNQIHENNKSLAENKKYIDEYKAKYAESSDEEYSDEEYPDDESSDECDLDDKDYISDLDNEDSSEDEDEDEDDNLSQQNTHNNYFKNSILVYRVDRYTRNYEKGLKLINDMKINNINFLFAFEDTNICLDSNKNITFIKKCLTQSELLSRILSMKGLNDAEMKRKRKRERGTYSTGDNLSDKMDDVLFISDTKKKSKKKPNDVVSDEELTSQHAIADASDESSDIELTNDNSNTQDGLIPQIKKMCNNIYNYLLD